MYKRSVFLSSILFFFSVNVFCQISDPTAQIRLDSINVLIDSAKYDQALLIGKQALSDYEKVTEQADSITAKIHNVIGKIFIKKAKPDSAFLYAQKALNILENSPNDHEVIVSYLNLGNSYYLFGDLNRAILNGKKGLEIAKRALGENHIKAADLNSNLGSYYKDNGEYIKAIELYEKALQIYGILQLENQTKTASVYYNLGLTNVPLERYDKAIEYYHKALQIFLSDSGENHPDVAVVYHGLGGIHHTKGEFNRAIEYFDKTLNIQSNILGSDHMHLAYTYLALGNTHQEKTNFKKAKECIEKALSILEHNVSLEHPIGAYAYHSLGVINYKLGDYQNAIDHNNEALRIRTEILGKNHRDVALTNRSLGIVHAEMKAYTKAIGYYQKALEVFQNTFGEENQNTEESYHDLGSVYMGTGNYNTAIKYVKKAISIFQNRHGGNNKSLAGYYNLLASIYTKKGESDLAIDYYDKALIISKGISEPEISRITPIYINLGLRHTEKNNLSKAKVFLAKSAQLLGYKSNEPENFEGIVDLILLRILFNAKRSYFETIYQENGDKKYLDSIKQNDQYALALEDYIQSELYGQGSREYHIAESFPIYENAISDLLKRHHATDSLTSFEIAEKSKSRLLSESFRKAESFANVPDSLIKQAYDISIDIAYYEKKLYQEKYENEAPNDSLVNTYEALILNLNQRQEKLRELLKNNYPDYHKLKYDHSVVSIRDIQMLLQNDQTIIEYFVGDSSIFVFVITPDSYKINEIKKDFPLEDWVKALRQSIYGNWKEPWQPDSVYAKNNAKYAQTAFKLYQKLFAPITSHLPEKLIIVPDGVLNFIPFEALLTSLPENPNDFKNHHYLIKDHQISYNYSATLFKQLSERRKEKGNKRLLAFAPIFGSDQLVSRNSKGARQGFDKLTYNVPEAKAVAELLEGDYFIGLNATKALFQEIADQYQVLHLATHGKSNDLMGDYSFIAFSETGDSIPDNERLYVRELYNMNISPHMVVLSACETALGEMRRGEGIISLAHGFTYAGAASTITSLWNVNDQQTTELMKRFYENIKKGMAKDEALRQAKLSYIKEPTRQIYVAPYFWSPFIASGNMEAIELKDNTISWYIGLSVLIILVVILIYFLFLRRKTSK